MAPIRGSLQRAGLEPSEGSPRGPTETHQWLQLVFKLKVKQDAGGARLSFPNQLLLLSLWSWLSVFPKRLPCLLHFNSLEDWKQRDHFPSLGPKTNEAEMSFLLTWMQRAEEPTASQGQEMQAHLQESSLDTEAQHSRLSQASPQVAAFFPARPLSDSKRSSPD
ncbi:PREDICTED: uncharacterized protein LOC109378263 [Hipposideros armiger]|uniref:Uncharacterized protein LOC109378263 n=1 Tax=Hipposideros armiger TaxID=186990 RepID=A0A8B7QNQ1_HIPAR|nr:PREDICTED: uncharacterized protein LOC109378263 [Hipposideros armiger]